MDILLLIVGLGLILAGANFLTDGSAALAQRFRVPEFIIGLTVVAVGTSTPELVVSVLSAIGGQSDVAIGNVVGSNIFNVFVILGVCALIRPVPLTAGNIRRDIPFGVLVSLLLLALAQDSLLCKGAADRIGRLDGAAMLALYILLMWYTIRKTKRPEATAPTEGSKAPMAAWLTAVMIVGGLAGLVFGGEMFLRQHPADPGRERHDPPTLDGRYHGLGLVDGPAEFGRGVPRGLHVQTQGHRPLGGSVVRGNLRRLYLVFDQVAVDQPRHGIVTQRSGRNGHRSSGRRQREGFDAVDDRMERLVGKLMFRQRDAAHEMPRSVAQQFAELRQAHELRQFGGPFGFDERKFVEPLPDVASLAAAQ